MMLASCTKGGDFPDPWSGEGLGEAPGSGTSVSATNEPAGSNQDTSHDDGNEGEEDDDDDHNGDDDPGSCSEAIAQDLGANGATLTVPNDACLMVRDGYPSWWETRSMRLEVTEGGTYPAPFDWANSCAGTSGTHTFQTDWDAVSIGPTSAACATIIELQGTGTGNIGIRYHAE